jgi:hypothetical protein
VLLVGGIAVAITNLTAGEPLRCSSMADRDKELKKAIDEWGAAIETPRETELKKKVEENSKLFFQEIRYCNEAKLVRHIVTVISLIFAGIGFLLTIVGFFIGRKKAIT